MLLKISDWIKKHKQGQAILEYAFLSPIIITLTLGFWDMMKIEIATLDATYILKNYVTRASMCSEKHGPTYWAKYASNDFNSDYFFQGEKNKFNSGQAPVNKTSTVANTPMVYYSLVGLEIDNDGKIITGQEQLQKYQKEQRSGSTVKTSNFTKLGSSVCMGVSIPMQLYTTKIFHKNYYLTKVVCSLSESTQLGYGSCT